jgi:hypothetical protein
VIDVVSSSRAPLWSRGAVEFRSVVIKNMFIVAVINPSSAILKWMREVNIFLLMSVSSIT